MNTEQKWLTKLIMDHIYSDRILKRGNQVFRQNFKKEVLSHWEDTRASSDGQSERERKYYNILFHKSSFKIIFLVRTGMKFHGICGQSHHVLSWAHRLFRTRQPSIGENKQGLEFIGRAFSVQFSSVAQSCPTLCNPMNCSTPGLPVHHQLPEFT